MIAAPSIPQIDERQIDAAHQQECRDSCIDDGITLLNWETLPGQMAIESVAGKALSKVGSHGQQYVTRETNRILARCVHLQNGGWLVTGLDPCNNWQRLEFGQFKPNTPRLKEDGQPQKYELQEGEPARLILLDVPDHIASKIYEKHGVDPSLEDRAKGFWHCVWLHNLPIVLCEGAKKAGCVLSAGYPAIALTGIRMGYRKDPERHLVADLAFFAQAGRTFIIAFDQDSKSSTRKNVASAEWATAKLLKAEGCTVLSTQWETAEGKGIDDVAFNAASGQISDSSAVQSWVKDAEFDVAKGWNKVSNILDNAVPLSQKYQNGKGFDPTNREYIARRRRFRFQQYWTHLNQDFTISVGANITEEYGGYCPTPDLRVADTIYVSGWLGSGKTEAKIRAIAQQAKDKTIFWIVPRNGLGRQAQRRLAAAGIYAVIYQEDVRTYREMLRTGQPGVYIMCVDSLKDYAVGDAKWEDAIFVVDEFACVRSEVLEKPREFPQFEQALRRAGTVVCIDAFLGDIDIGIVSQYRKGSIKIYKQLFKKSPKPVTWLETRTKQGELAFAHDKIYLSLLSKWVAEGKSIAIASDNKTQLKALAMHLESLGGRPLVISADTPDESFPFMEDPDNRWKESDFTSLLYSPTAQNGLDVQTPFDVVLVICNGTLMPLQMMQMSGRCRQCKEIFVSAPRRSIEAEVSTKKIEPAKLKAQAEKLSLMMQTEGWAHSTTSATWQVWQETVKDISKQFNSEYMRELLDYFFENVTELTIEEGDTATYRKLLSEVKRSDGDKTLRADLGLGKELIAEKKNPKTDTEVWAYKLAQTVEKYPLTESFAEQYKTTDSPEDAAEILEVFLLFTSNRLNRLKHWLMAQDSKCVEELEESLNNSFVTFNCRLLRAYLNIRLFRDLRLDRLAVCSRNQEAVIDKTHFSIHSPIVAELWEEFQRSDLPDLFFGVESIQDMWKLVGRCMTAMGFKSKAKRIRVDTEELHKNGKYRNGEVRYSPSAPTYFSAWLRMEESGSEKFREMFPVIRKAIEDMIQRDRDKREQRKLSGLSPGDIEENDPVPRIIDVMNTCESWEEYKRKIPDRATAQRAWDYLKSYPEGKRLACKLQDKLKRLKLEAAA